MSNTDIWLLSVANEAIVEVEKLLATFALHASWSPQVSSGNSFQARLPASLDQGQVETMASELSKLCHAFEITNNSEEAGLFLYFKGLGLKRVPLDAAGEPIIRIGRLNHLMEVSAGSNAELARLIRLEAAIAWLDVLEPYRRSTTRVEMMPRAV